MIKWLKKRSKPNVKNRYKFTRLAPDLPPPYGVNYDGSGADYHASSRYEIYGQAEIARDLDRNNVLVRHSLDRLVSNIIHGGFMPEPDTGRKSLNRQLKEKWDTWVNDPIRCDVQQEWTFLQLSQIVAREIMIAGDVLAIPLTSGQLQLIEQFRIRTYVSGEQENIVHGVQLTQQRKRQAYYVTKDVIPLNRPVAQNDVTRIAAYTSDGERNAFFVYLPSRISETRGFTKLAGIRDYCLMFDQVHQARLGQQQSLASMAIIRERDIDFELPEAVQETVQTEYDDCAGVMREVEELPRNSMYTTYPGERMTALNNTTPSMSQLDHLTAIEDLIALNLELPPIVLRMDATATNFSGWRGAMEVGKLRWRAIQRSICSQFHDPVWRWKLVQWSTPGSEHYDEQIGAARMTIGDERFFSNEFILPTWASVQPEVDNRVDIEAMGNTVDSPRSIQRKRGRNWNKVVQDSVEDRSLAIETALKEAQRLNSRYPDADIKWTDLIGLPQPQGSNVSRSSQDDAETQEAPANAE